jgi:hypothetical protein
MFSKRELEGYLEIDHRESPGITPELAAKIGRGTVPVPAGTVFKAATYNCSHCEALVIINPKRTRTRGYCAKCDHYVCDLCETERVRTGVCRPFKQVIDEFIDKTAKGA